MFEQTITKIPKLGDIKKVSFRELVPEIPSTTYGTFGLYRYPAKFIPQVIASILKDYGHPNMKILDPFAGCGTTGLVSRMYGMDYELWDLNPMLKALHSVAIMKPVNINVNFILKEISQSKEIFIPSWSNISYWFPDNILPFLFNVWGYYHSLQDGSIKRLLLVPLLKVTRKFSYNDPQRQKLSKSPRASKRVENLLEGDWKNKFFSSLKKEIESVQQKISDYQNITPIGNYSQAKIRAGLDTTGSLFDVIKQEDIWDAVITSPPYLQAQEYIRSTKIDLFWLGYNEEAIKNLSKKELPYKQVEMIDVQSDTYKKYHNMINEPHLKKMYENYFSSVLGLLSKISSSVNEYLFLFVGPASVRSVPIPIDRIFAEHFVNLGWRHTQTLVDLIPARVMFRAKKNPSTGLKDMRIKSEQLVILRREN